MSITGFCNNPEYMILMLSLHAPLHQITSFLLGTSLLFLYLHLTVACIYDIQVISWIYKLYPILIHPFLLSPALKCLNMDQFCKDYPEICFLTCYVKYLSNTYSHQVPDHWKGYLDGTGLPLHMFICLLCTFWKHILDKCV